MKTVLRIIKQHPSLAVLVLILLFSFPPRLWKLTTMPPLIVDEPAYLRDIDALMKYKDFHLSDNQWDGSQATLMYYPTIILIKNFGMSDHLAALRFVSVFYSLLALIPFFYIIKRHISLTIASCTTILFSYSYYYLEFSRVGWGVIYAMSLGLCALGAAYVAIEKKSYLWILISGIFSALCFYSYRAGEIYIAASILLLFIRFSSFKQLPHKFAGLVLFLLAFIVIAAPWIYTIVRNYSLFTYREKVVSIFDVQLPYHGSTTLFGIFQYQITTTLGSWLLMLPSYETFNEDLRYLPLRYPFLNIFLIPFYWWGIIHAIKQLKNTYIWIFIGTASLILGQILTFYPPNGARGLVFLPISYFLIGIALYALYKRFSTIKYIEFIFVTASLIIACTDFLFYIYWMSWIKV